MLKFTSEIVDDVLTRADEPTDGTSDFDSIALDKVNRAYREIYVGGSAFVPDMNEPWLWLKKDPPGVLVLNPVITAGSVSVTNNNTGVTFSSPPAVSVAGRFLKVDGGSIDVFRVAAHTAGQPNATLDSVYTGLTAGGLPYKLMQLEYTLASDVIRVIAPMRAQQRTLGKVDGIDLPSLDRDYPLTTIDGGMPDKFALVTESNSAGPKIRFNRYGGTLTTDLYRVEYDYLARPNDLTNSASEEPLIPLEFRSVLADAALFYLLTDKNDNRAATVAAQVKAGLKMMQANNRAKLARVNGEVGRLYPRQRTQPAGLRILQVGA